MDSNFATASQVADAIYAVQPSTWERTTTPDGRESVEAPNGWSVFVVDDPDDLVPNGITWWMDGPDERLVESDGWEALPTAMLKAEAEKVASFLASRK